MDQVEAKETAATEMFASVPPVGATPEVAKIEAPSIFPPSPEGAASSLPIAALGSPKGESAAPPAAAKATAPEADPAPVSIPLTARWRLGRIAPIAAAALLGITAGALGSTSLARLAPLLSAPAERMQEPSVPSEIAQLRAEIAALKTGIESGSRSTSAQIAKLGERFDRLERTQAAAAKPDMTLAKETTGSISPPAASATPLPPAAPPQPAVSGWVLRDVYRGAAMLQSRVLGLIEVEVGDIVPGLGRIESIHRQDGHWVVATSKGVIVSAR